MIVSYILKRPKMMEFLKAGDMLGYWVESHALTEMTTEWGELAIAFAKVYGCLEVRTDRDEEYHHWWYLHRSVRGDYLQLTTYDDDGPVGHIDVRTPYDLSDWARANASELVEFDTRQR